MQPTEKSLLTNAERMAGFAIAAAGAASFGVGLFTDPARSWQNLLLNNSYFLSIAMMAAFFIAVHVLAGAEWTTALRRAPEAMTGYFPIGAALALATLFGASSIYVWAAPGAADHDPILQAKSAYLNLPAFAVRMIVILAIWAWFLRALRRGIGRESRTESPAYRKTNGRLCAAFVVIFALTYSVAAIDWLMSLEPHWFSTLFPWYVMSSAFAGSLALLTLLAVGLHHRGALEGLGRRHLHDLGKYVFAFSVFWGYLWFSQYMLIWYANFPEETPYYLLRSEGWNGLFIANVVINLGVPFVLLPAKNKQRPWLLASVCAVLVAGHWLDFYLLAMPPQLAEGPRFGLIEIGIALGIGSVFVLAFDRTLRRIPPPSPSDPNIQASLAHSG